MIDPAELAAAIAAATRTRAACTRSAAGIQDCRISHPHSGTTARVWHNEETGETTVEVQTARGRHPLSRGDFVRERRRITAEDRAPALVAYVAEVFRQAEADTERKNARLRGLGPYY